MSELSYLMECMKCHTLKETKTNKGRHCKEDMTEVGWVETAQDTLRNNPNQQDKKVE